MPALPVSLLEPLWAQFSALLPEHPEVDPTHPLGCHRRRTPDQVVFAHVLAALVHGSGYERIASPGCSDRTIRRRVQAWAEAGLMPQLHALVLAQYDRLIGLDLRHVCVDGCITKAPGGGDVAGRSPVDRGKQGRKRSLLTDAAGIPLHLVAAGANRPDSTLLRETLGGLGKLGPLPPGLPVLLDRGYRGAPVQAVLAERGCVGVLPAMGRPAAGSVGARWVVERTHSWLNDFGRLRRCPERSAAVVDFYVFLAASIIVIQQLLRAAVQSFRWSTRSTTRRLR
ncbi:MAG: IS5 family transposase [Chloroflexota bacterium]|nr:IS5 family transposase [Chloroflexota bacterium]